MHVFSVVQRPARALTGCSHVLFSHSGERGTRSASEGRKRDNNGRIKGAFGVFRGLDFASEGTGLGRARCDRNTLRRRNRVSRAASFPTGVWERETISSLGFRYSFVIRHSCFVIHRGKTYQATSNAIATRWSGSTAKAPVYLSFVATRQAAAQSLPVSLSR